MLFKILFVLYSISSIVSLFGSCAALAGSANKMWIYIFIMSATNVAIFGKLISMNDSISTLEEKATEPKNNDTDNSQNDNKKDS